MPKINIITEVNNDYEKVFDGFNLELFGKLTPPFIPFKILKFDGCKVGDEVHIELDFIFFKQLWISKITENFKDAEEIFFIDEGIKLPFFLKKWKHKHIIQKSAKGSKIIDAINFQTPFFIPDIAFYPIMYFMFFYRKKIYSSFFNI